VWGTGEGSPGGLGSRRLALSEAGDNQPLSSHCLPHPSPQGETPVSGGQLLQ
jgi:hypothetical protein